jgi:hypothetical protein
VFPILILGFCIGFRFCFGFGLDLGSRCWFRFGFHLGSGCWFRFGFDIGSGCWLGFVLLCSGSQATITRAAATVSAHTAARGSGRRGVSISGGGGSGLIANDWVRASRSAATS